jgi:hypothetical protein
VAPVENREAYAIEARQPQFGAHPQVTIGGLGDSKKTEVCGSPASVAQTLCRYWVIAWRGSSAMPGAASKTAAATSRIHGARKLRVSRCTSTDISSASFTD